MSSIVNAPNGNLELLDTVGGGQTRSIAQLKQAGVDKHDLIVIIYKYSQSSIYYLYSSILQKSFLLNPSTTQNTRLYDFGSSHAITYDKSTQLWTFPGASLGGNCYIYGVNL